MPGVQELPRDCTPGVQELPRDCAVRAAPGSRYLLRQQYIIATTTVPPTLEQVQILLRVLVRLHEGCAQLVWPGVVLDVLHNRCLWGEEWNWSAGEEVAWCIADYEVGKELGVSEKGAEFLFQRVSSGIPRVLNYLRYEGLEDFVWSLEDSQAHTHFRRISFTDLDVLLCVYT